MKSQYKPKIIAGSSNTDELVAERKTIAVLIVLTILVGSASIFFMFQNFNFYGIFLCGILQAVLYRPLLRLVSEFTNLLILTEGKR